MRRGRSEIYNMGVLCGNSKERGYLEDLDKKGDKMKVDFNEFNWVVVDWIDVDQDKNKWQAGIASYQAAELTACP